MRKYAVFLFLSIQSICFSQQMRIGVYRDFSIKKIVFAYNDGGFGVYGDTSYYGTILPNEFVEIEYLSKGIVQLSIGAKEITIDHKIRLIPTQSSTSIVYSPKNTSAKERKYKDEVEITANDKDLTIINLVDMNQYLSGVVESEGGGGKELEYYKVQTIISRTYALKNSQKHQNEGFNLCDRTHCQAYFNQNRFTPLIDSAVIQTNGQVLVDEKHKLVDTYFHANCGGQTSEPDYVWNAKISYLHSFKDTFCIYTKQATWEKRIPKNDWTAYLVNEFHFPLDDSLVSPLIFNFNQPERMAFYLSPALGIPLRDIRDNFKLKSTFFNTFLDGDEVVVRGRGFGHGVGLCQEGAMKMAKFKFTSIQILLYYYPGAQLVDSNKLNLSEHNWQEVKMH